METVMMGAVPVVWEFLDATSVEAVQVARSWRSGTPWMLVCRSCFDCDDPAGIDWREAFELFCWVTRADAGSLVACLQRLPVPFARVACAAFAEGRLGSDAAGCAVAAAMIKAPTDAKLAQTGARALLAMQQTGPVVNADVIDALQLAYHHHPALVEESLCAFGSSTSDAIAIDSLAKTNFFDVVIVDALKRHCDDDPDGVVFTACRALRELAVAAKASSICRTAVEHLRDDVVVLLQSLVVRADAGDRLVRYAASAICQIAGISSKHRTVYAVYALRIQAALRGRLAKDSASSSAETITPRPSR